MDSSTEISTTATKRTRFSSDDSATNSTAKIEKPKKMLFSLIRGSLASLPLKLIPILEQTTFDYIALLRKLETKEKFTTNLTKRTI